MKRILLTAMAAALAASSAQAAGDWQKLLTPSDLAALDGVTIVDIRSPDDYAAGHVAGAVNAPYGKWRGPADNPGAVIGDAQLTEVLQNAGLDHQDKVVVVSSGANQTDFGAAARVYWTLKSAGFPEIAILNGGIAGWTAEGEPLSTDAVAVAPHDETFTLSDKWMVEAGDVASIVAGESKGTLIDARPDPFFKGETKHKVAAKAGTLKGAESLPFANWFDGDDVKITNASHAADLATGLGADEGDEIVSFCNTGHWAATNWFALSELAGKDNVKLYPESMVGWVKNGGEAVPGE
ncbi:rhodanese-like domain-containing protein [Acuticoccus sp. MNP-M23]|uniref:sulfurtransferase n=1 Tax=Acuticoccus sp. MNP-M23 TaxID=3072793 RepID=UPI002814C3A3|nr:rhodanese-like domain-containing protein [Acuticoccus sp. MNP-M23]WMS44156.1 rhodanese-like domain-containing protein [Acuticoccus sp. MNP-M23]